MPARPLTVVEAGRTPSAARDDVVVLADRGVAVRCSAPSVAQEQEAFQRRGELPCPRLDGDDLTDRGMNEQLAQHRSDPRPVRTVAVLGRILRFGERPAQLVAQRLGGDGAVALDVRGLAVLG